VAGSNNYHGQSERIAKSFRLTQWIDKSFSQSEWERVIITIAIGVR